MGILTIMGKISRTAKRMGLRRSCRILFIAPNDFHLQHIVPIMLELKLHDGVKVSLVKHPGMSTQGLGNIEIIPVEFFRKSYLRFYDCVVTTEFNRIPWWLNPSRKIASFHGVGPKSGYLEKLKDNEFDYVLSPGPTFTTEVEKILDSDRHCVTRLRQVGLPSTDTLEKRVSKPADLPTVMYAPSWHSNPNYISMDESILCALAEVPDIRLILRPHPNLLVKDRCGGKAWRKTLETIKTSDIELSLGGSVYDLLPRADILVGDISSLMYEFLFYDRPGLLYVNDAVLNEGLYDGARERIIEAYARIDDVSEIGSAIQQLIRAPDTRKDKRYRLFQDTFYNPGNAAISAANSILDIAKHN